jgi:hypothetical protein
MISGEIWCSLTYTRENRLKEDGLQITDKEPYCTNGCSGSNFTFAFDLDLLLTLI